MKIELSKSQLVIYEDLKNFLSEKNRDKVYILKGYAGTGKTILIKEIVDFAFKIKQKPLLMAPTGKAARVLRDKTGLGNTIHQSIYTFDKLECKEVSNSDLSKKSLHYYFPIANISGINFIVVDESSMISDVENKMSLFTFGSGYIFSDILLFAEINSIKKIIFVGDSAQLTPVNSNCSIALESYIYKNKNIPFHVGELSEIHRQECDSGIMNLSLSIRNILNNNKRNRFKISPNSYDIFKVDFNDVADIYVKKYSLKYAKDSVVICFSNRKAYEYNQRIRRLYFKDINILHEGDLLLINSNNYHAYPVPLLNGDVVSVKQVLSKENVRIDVYNKGVKEEVCLVFRNLILTKDGFDFKCKVFENLLNSKERSLSELEYRAAYIYFIIRWKNKFPVNKEEYKEGGFLFKESLKKDLYYNALQVKYAYAITCHKAQGSEWDTVFVDYDGQVGLKDSQLRWCYTASTRAKKNLFVINEPNISPYASIKVDSISKINKISKNFYSNSISISSPLHSKVNNIGVLIKFFTINKYLKKSNYKIEKIDSFPFLEKYYFNNGFETIKFDLYYKSSGVFTNTKQNLKHKELVEIINRKCEFDYDIKYSPSNKILKNIYQLILKKSKELDIYITNIIEDVDSYYVDYFFISDGDYSQIKIYFKGNDSISKCIPTSSVGEKDFKLKKLLELFKDVEQ